MDARIAIACIDISIYIVFKVIDPSFSQITSELSSLTYL